MSSFEEAFPSLKDKNTVVQREGECCLEDDLYYEDVISRHTLDKQRVREGITKGLGVIISPKCKKPYGDTCGYCVDCKRYQNNIRKNIFINLGLEDE